MWPLWSGGLGGGRRRGSTLIGSTRRKNSSMSLLDAAQIQNLSSKIICWSECEFKTLHILSQHHLIKNGIRDFYYVWPHSFSWNADVILLPIFGIKISLSNMIQQATQKCSPKWPCPNIRASPPPLCECHSSPISKSSKKTAVKSSISQSRNPEIEHLLR